MNPKELYLDQAGQTKLHEGIRKTAAAVKSTLGPDGMTVLMESHNTPGGFKSTKDGVSVAREIRFLDPVEDVAALLLKQVCETQSKDSGDGTTTAIVLTEALLDAYKKYVPDSSTTSVVSVTRGLQKLSEDIVASMMLSATPATDMLEQVATISANNDPEIGKLLAEAFSQTDVVTFKNGTAPETTLEVVNGIKVERGLYHKMFATNHAKGIAELEDPYVLLYDGEINNLHGLKDLLTEMAEKKESLLIIAEVSVNALQALGANAVQFTAGEGGLRSVLVQRPDFGERKGDKMRDLAKAVGCHYFSEDSGDDLQLVTKEKLGKVKRVVVEGDKTIIEPNPEDLLNVAEVLTELRELEKKPGITEQEKRDLKSRIECISGVHAVIHVGGFTEVERKELYDRIEDAVCAVQSAKEGGVLPGGGMGLIQGLEKVTKVRDEIPEVCYTIMGDVVEAPLRQMLENSGKSMEEIHKILSSVDNVEYGKGYNVKTSSLENLFESGVIDPCKVTVSALRNAVSVATTILNTKCIVTNIRETETH